MQKIKVLITNNYRLDRDTLTNAINSDKRLEVIAECNDTDEVIDLELENKPDVVLLTNISFPLFSSVEATKKIRAKYPLSHVIGIFPDANPTIAKKMMTVGARGCLTKNASKEELIESIVEVSKGNKYLSEEIKESMLQQVFFDKNEEEPETTTISKREEEIIGLIRDGYTSKEIAKMLFISYRTVEVHRHNILKKLRLKNAASLIRYANMNLYTPSLT